MRFELATQHLGEPGHAELRGTVTRVAVHADKTAHRGDEADVARPPLGHRRRDRMSGIHRAHEVHFDVTGEIGDRALYESAGLAESRARQQHVDGTGRRRGLTDRSLDLRAVRDVT